MSVSYASLAFPFPFRFASFFAFAAEILALLLKGEREVSSASSDEDGVEYGDILGDDLLRLDGPEALGIKEGSIEGAEALEIDSDGGALVVEKSRGAGDIDSRFTSGSDAE